MSSGAAPLTWTVFEGTDTDGVAIVGRFDRSFKEIASRAGRSTLVMSQFYGPYMLKSGENRGEFEDSLAAFLGERDGVFAAGCGRMAAETYTFYFYLNGPRVRPDDVPIPYHLKAISRVFVVRDPAWKEYESFAGAPSKSVASRVLSAIAGMMRPRAGLVWQTQTDPAVEDVDQIILDRMAASGIDLTKSMEITFFLYFKSYSDAQVATFAILNSGFRAHLYAPSPDEANAQWLVCALVHTPPTIAALRKFGQPLKAYAEEHGGTYDFWEIEEPDAGNSWWPFKRRSAV